MNNMFVLVPFYINVPSNWVALFLLTFFISGRMICSQQSKEVAHQKHEQNTGDREHV